MSEPIIFSELCRKIRLKSSDGYLKLDPKKMSRKREYSDLGRFFRSGYEDINPTVTESDCAMSFRRISLLEMTVLLADNGYVICSFTQKLKNNVHG